LNFLLSRRFEADRLCDLVWFDTVGVCCERHGRGTRFRDDDGKIWSMREEELADGFEAHRFILAGFGGNLQLCL
jgi:hypothetical protein